MKKRICLGMMSILALASCMGGDVNLAEERAKYDAMMSGVTQLDAYVARAEAADMSCHVGTCNPKAQICEGIYDASDDDYMGTTTQYTDAPGTFTRFAMCTSPQPWGINIVYCQTMLMAAEADGEIASVQTSKICTGP